MTPLKRPVAASLKAALRDTRVVCLLGPRQPGKTTLARTLEKRHAYVSFDNEVTLTFAQADRAASWPRCRSTRSKQTFVCNEAPDGTKPLMPL